MVLILKPVDHGLKKLASMVQSKQLRDICVKMKTTIGVLLLSISLIGCSSKTPYYTDMSLGKNYKKADNVYELLFQWGEHSAHDLPDSSKAKHENCVYFALDNAQVGEACKWIGEGGVSDGTVRVAQIDPDGCHYLMNTVYNKTRSMSWVDKACFVADKWHFRYHSS